jgi:hypothetical protein
MTTHSAGKDIDSVFWNSQGVLFIDFLKEQRTISAAYLELLKDPLNPAFR